MSGPACPWISDFSLQGWERAGSCCFKSPICGPWLQRPQDAGSGRGSEAPRVCLEAHGCLELGLGETGGAPTSCRSSHSGLLLPRLSLSLPTFSGGSPSKLGARAHCVPPWGMGRGLRTPPRQPIPLVVLGGGASFRDPISRSGQQHFPKPWAHPEAPRGASTDQGSVRVSGSGLGAFLPGRRVSGSRNSGIQDPPSLRTLLPEGSAANEWENG